MGVEVTPVLGLVDTTIKLVTALVKLSTLKEGRKYIDSLVELRQELLEMDQLDPREVDDVRYVEIQKQIQITVEASISAAYSARSTDPAGM